MTLSSTCFLVAAQKTDSPDRSRYKLGGGSAAARLRLTLEASVGVGCILAIRSMVEVEQFNLLRVRPLVRPTRSGRSDLLDRDYHPEWGILALGESSMRTLRLLAVATAIGAVIGGGMVFSMSRPLEEEDARSPVPGAINTRSTETSDRFQQPPEHQPAPLPSVSNIEPAQAPLTATVPLNSDRSTLQANSEVDKLHSNPISDTAASHETASPEGARHEAHQSSLPIATEESARRPKLRREAKRNIAKQRELTPRPREQETQSRGNDLSSFQTGLVLSAPA
jgi:hypothetical protein